MIQVAIFGAGRIAPVHAENIARHPDCRIRYIIDPVTMAAEQALANSAIKTVLIASSTDTHADLIEASA